MELWSGTKKKSSHQKRFYSIWSEQLQDTNWPWDLRNSSPFKWFARDLLTFHANSQGFCVYSILSPSHSSHPSKKLFRPITIMANKYIEAFMQSLTNELKTTTKKNSNNKYGQILSRSSIIYIDEFGLCVWMC